MSPKPETLPAPPHEEPAPETQPEAPAPGRKVRAHKCDCSKASVRETSIEGTAPGKWLPCKEGEPGAFCDPEGRWQRWHKTGREAKFSVHVHPLAPGDAARISHVTTRFGVLPRDHGVVHWTVDGDGNLVVRPAMPGHDLDLEVHLFDDGVPGG